ncbi:Gfo/Idh/MocA family oxidoreductase [Aeromicrobium sp. NPDC092404]|uniref:Gfo/Idh/MocA family protein n=1 Tax=Aeromicrobium sp. NPDC092404 TaxID=3154976 RepID=UPI0034151763
MDLAAFPSPRTPDPMEAPPLRWGVMGPGWIAAQFTESLQTYTRQEVVAVGSRALPRAQEFADTYGVRTAVGSYEELAALDDVDIVYVATPHPAHLEHAILSLESGKHVVVEKPIGLSASQAREIAAVAERTGLYCAEALWTMFLPKWDVVRQVVEDGALGTITSVHSEYGEAFPEGHRVFDPALAGGPLLDLGIYPLAFITSILGPHESVAALGQQDPHGVNGQLGATMTHAGGTLSVLSTTLHGLLANQVTIVGTEGVLTVEPQHHSPGPLTLRRPDRTLTYDEPRGNQASGLHFQAAEAARRIAAGETRTPLWTLDHSIVALEASDEIRRQIGDDLTAAGLHE